MALLLLATLVGVATARSAQVALPAPVVGRAEDVVVEDAEVVPGAGRLLLHGCHRHQCAPPPPSPCCPCVHYSHQALSLSAHARERGAHVDATVGAVVCALSSITVTEELGIAVAGSRRC